MFVCGDLQCLLKGGLSFPPIFCGKRGVAFRHVGFVLPCPNTVPGEESADKQDAEDDDRSHVNEDFTADFSFALSDLPG